MFLFSISPAQKSLFKVVSMNHRSARRKRVRSIFWLKFQKALAVSGILEEEFLKQQILTKNVIQGMCDFLEMLRYVSSSMTQTMHRIELKKLFRFLKMLKNTKHVLIVIIYNERYNFLQSSQIRHVLTQSNG